MSAALLATKRPIFFSICNWGEESTATWAPAIGNSWRTTGDINASFGSVRSNIISNNGDASSAGIGAWNDPDMLEIGVVNSDGTGLTKIEEKTHFALWAISKAPLILGNDIRSLDSDTKAIITNTGIIGIS